MLLIDAGRLSAAPLGDRDDRSTRRSTPPPRSRSSPTSSATACGAVAFDDEVRAALAPRPRGRRRPSCARSSTSSRARATATTSSRSGAPRAASARSWSCSATCSRRPPRGRSSRAVPVLTRRHAVVVASPSDPALEALAERRGRPRCAGPRDRRRRRPRGARPRRRAGPRGGRARHRGAAGPARGALVARLPARQVARGPLNAADHERPEHDDQRERRARPGPHGQLRPGARSPPARRTSTSHGTVPARHLHGGHAPRAAATSPRAQRARPDQRPAHPQPGDRRRRRCTRSPAARARRPAAGTRRRCPRRSRARAITPRMQPVEARARRPSGARTRCRPRTRAASPGCC